MSLKRIKISSSIFHQRGGADVRRQRVYPALLGEGIRPNTSTQDRQRNPLLSAGRHRRNTPGLPPGERAGDDTGGRRQKLKENPETTIRHEEIVNRLKQIKEELLAMKEAFEALEASK